MSGIWITCPHCGEKRDTSNRYTSPANAARDARLWKERHESGACKPAPRRPSTITPPLSPDTYADKVTKLRVYRMRPNESDDADYAEPGTLFDEEGYVNAPWQLDGFNENTSEVTEYLNNYVSHAAAVAGIPQFITDYGVKFEPFNTPEEIPA